MTYWEGLEIKADTKVKYYETDHKTVTKANASEFFQTFLGNAKLSGIYGKKLVSMGRGADAIPVLEGAAAGADTDWRLYSYNFV